MSATFARPHGLFAKILHWGFVAVLAFAIYKQVDNISQLSDPWLLRFEMIFAASFLALLAFRFTYMRAVGASALPDSTPRLIKLAARLGHLAIYIAVGIMALSGLMIGALYWMGLQDGLAIGLALGLHELSVTASYVIVAGHVLAALYHRIKGDGVWSAMVPVFKETPK